MTPEAFIDNAIAAGERLGVAALDADQRLVPLGVGPDTAGEQLLAEVDLGELAEPVREFTIASTLQKMLHDAVAVGNDQEWLPMNAAGVTLVVADVTMSGE